MQHADTDGVQPPECGERGKTCALLSTRRGGVEGGSGEECADARGTQAPLRTETRVLANVDVEHRPCSIVDAVSDVTAAPSLSVLE